MGKVEFLGACVNSPVVKINDDYFEDLNSQTLNKLIETITKNKVVKIGPQSKRKGTEPVK